MIIAKKNLKVLWNYLINTFEQEEIVAAFGNVIEDFEYDPATIDIKMIDALPEKKARSLFFDVGYMAANELFGGDFETWYDVLEYTLEFDAETIKFLDF